MAANKALPRHMTWSSDAGWLFPRKRRAQAPVCKVLCKVRAQPERRHLTVLRNLLCWRRCPSIEGGCGISTE